MPVEQLEPPANLRQRLMQFTLSEVEAFCHDLGINPQLLRHQKLDEFVLDLLGHCQRRPGFTDRLTQLVEQAEAERAIPPAEGECPYKGLQAYEETDAHLFFGREKLTQELVKHLQMKKCNFLAVVGASGSGKSSVVKAGVIPQLRQDNQWLVVPPFRPGSDPFEQTIAGLLPFYLNPTKKAIAADAELQIEEKSLLKAVKEGRVTLTEIAKRIIKNNPGQKRLLLVIDQFEELFTNQKNKHSQEQWLCFLTEPLNQTRNQLTLLLTLRADFYGYAAQSATLKPLLQTQQVIVPLMTPAELKEAITRPAAQAWRFQDGLVDAILADVAQEPGVLPFLSQALLKTWEKRQGRELTLAGYLASGGVKEAISKTAEQVYNQFTPPAQDVMRGVLLRLTQLGEGREDTRRRLTQPELVGLPYPPKLVQEVLGELTAPQVRLLTQDQKVLEVAHEALIRGWPLLRHWLDEDREGLRLHRQLTEAAGEWEKLGRDKSVLWRGARLIQLEGWDGRKSYLTPLEREFFRESKTEEKRIAEEQEAQQQKELAAAKQLAEAKENRLRIIRSALGGAILLMLALIIVAMLATNFAYEADQNFSLALTRGVETFNAQETAITDRAIAQTEASKAINAQGIAEYEATRATQNLATATYNENLARLQANQTQSLALVWALNSGLSSGHIQSVLLKLEALSFFSRQEVLSDLSEQLFYLAQPELNLFHNGTPKSASWNDSENLILTGSEDGMAQIWDTETGNKLLAFPHGAGVVVTEWSKSNTQILTVGIDKIAKVWDAQTGELMFTLLDNSITSAKWNHSGTHIMTSGWDNDTVKVWDAKTGNLAIELPHNDVVLSTDWSPQDNYILTISQNGVGRVWNIEMGEVKFVIDSVDLDDFEWDQNEKYILIVTKEHKAELWNIEEEERETVFNDVTSAQLNSQATQILIGRYSFERAEIWDIETESAPQLFFINEPIESVEWDLAETHILINDKQGNISVWFTNLPGSQPKFILNHEKPVSLIKSNLTHILTQSDDKTINLWNAKNGKLEFILEHGDNLTSVLWNQTGNRIITSSKDGFVRVWNLEKGNLQLMLGHDVMSATINKTYTHLLISNKDEASVWNFITRERELIFTGHNLEVSSVQWSPDGTQILTSSYDRTARIWDAKTGNLIRLFSNEEAQIKSAHWNHDGTQIITVDINNIATVWDVSNGQVLFLLTHDGIINSIEWNKNQSYILTASNDSTAKLWDAQNGELSQVFTHEGAVNSATWNQEGSHILTISTDKTVRVWDIEMAKSSLILRHDKDIQSAQWNKDETRILTASSDGTVKQWNSETGELISDILHENWVREAQWSTSDKYILSLDIKGVARLWNAETRDIVLIMKGDGSEIVRAEWSADESRLWIVTANGLVRSYYTDPQELIAEACSRATRNLTWEEWQTYLPGRPYRQTCPNLPVHESVPESERP